LIGGLPAGTADSRFVAMVQFKAHWEALKARTTPQQLQTAYRAMNTGGDD
jgi:hypothetical protein